MRESWTDERLDDFRREVNERFGRVEDQSQGLRGEMSDGFKAIAETSTQMERHMDTLFDAIYRVSLMSAVAIIVALIGAAKF